MRIALGNSRRDALDDLRLRFGANVSVVISSIGLGIYALLLLCTRSLDQGDTMLYAGNVVHELRGAPDVLWEFGHPLWRPLAYVVMRITELVSATTVDVVLRRRAVAVLTCMAVAGGVLAVLACLSWFRRLGISWLSSLAAVLALMLTSAFLGFAQTGSAYIPSLAFLLLGLREMAAEDSSTGARAVLLPSAAFTVAVLFWFPMVLAVPGAALSVLILSGDTPRRRRAAVAVCVCAGTMTILSYAIIAHLANVRTPDELRAWIVSAGHGISGIGGAPRVVMGFARSLIDTGRLGIIVKRHMIGDPYNSTSLNDVFHAGLARIAVLYLGGAALVYRLIRRAEGRRALTVLLVTAIPVVGFAYKWQGGDPERYLALYPALFVTLALMLSSLPQQAGELVAMFVIVVFAGINVPAMSRTKAAAECAALTARLASIPHTDGRTPVVVTPNALDPILEYRARCPDVALASSSQAPQAFGLVMPHAVDAPNWRASLAARAGRTWDAGDHLWASRRAFAPKPSASWDWTEGDDPRVHWRDFSAFCNRLDTGVAVGGADGFVEILPTSKNRRLMQEVDGADASDTARAISGRS
jgi:hypothetical protein